MPGLFEFDAQRILASPNDLALTRALTRHLQFKFVGAVKNVGCPKFCSGRGQIEDEAPHHAAAMLMHHLAAHPQPPTSRPPPFVTESDPRFIGVRLHCVGVLGVALRSQATSPWLIKGKARRHWPPGHLMRGRRLPRTYEAVGEKAAPPDVLRQLAHDCPKRGGIGNDSCGAYFLDIAERPRRSRRP